jgi:Lar family restriction alleviation protein
MPDLKRCPFCGGEAVLHPATHISLGREAWAHVTCSGCSAESDYFFNGCEEVANSRAIAAWNRRVTKEVSHEP